MSSSATAIAKQTRTIVGTSPSGARCASSPIVLNVAAVKPSVYDVSMAKRE